MVLFQDKGNNQIFQKWEHTNTKNLQPNIQFTI